MSETKGFDTWQPVSPKNHFEFLRDLKVRRDSLLVAAMTTQELYDLAALHQLIQEMEQVKL